MGDVAIALRLDSMAETPVTTEAEIATRSANGAAEELSDELLMAGYAHGETEAFAQLFTRYRQPLVGFFYRRLADTGHAEELAQECFVAVIRSAARYRPSATFRTYIYAIAFKILRAHRRKTAFRSMFWGAAPEGREPAATGEMHSEMALREAVRKLEPMDREVLLLREFEELRYAEIAELLDLPLNTVRSRLFRARAALREVLASPGPAKAAEKDESGRQA
jgi:RNA polymerase sigma-70 factor (ECF subfamily)